jgi:GMP synthase-like glutamine amidotransferase
MRVLVVENYPKTPLGLVGQALAEAGAECEILRMHAGDSVPGSHEAHDAFVLLGGGQNALDDAHHPYLPAEAALARSFGEADKAVLGICLGAQLVARAHGGQNILGRPVEFGWRNVSTTDQGGDDPVISKIAPGAPLFHWHSDTFTLPPGAVHLASSDMTWLQAFRIGRAVYGIQFHFEADTELVARWNRDFAEEIEPLAPNWFAAHPDEARTNGAAADAAGRSLARAWVGLIR